MQAWEFVILKDPDARRKLVDTTDNGNTARAGVYTQEWIMQAPVVVVVCYDVKRMTGRYGQKGRNLLTIMDCMLCVENMVLAATHFGLGTCCVVGFDPKQLKDQPANPQGNHPAAAGSAGLPCSRRAKAPVPDPGERINPAGAVSRLCLENVSENQDQFINRTQ